MDFNDFYQVYPRHKDKLAAQKAWDKAIKITPPESIVNGAKKYAEKCARERTEERFIKLPATWLNHGCWADEDMPAYTAKFGLGRTIRTSEMNERWETWKAVRRAPVARQAAKEGWSWNLRCKVLDGSISTPDQINPTDFLLEHQRSAKNQEKVERGNTRLIEPFIAKYMDGRRLLLIREAETVEEILGHAGAERLEPKYNPGPDDL